MEAKVDGATEQGWFERLTDRIQAAMSSLNSSCTGTRSQKIPWRNGRGNLQD
jgi:hypothetical protein